MGSEKMLHKNIRTLRKINQYSQERLAEKLHVSRQAIAKWENGETLPDLTNIIGIANLFDVTLDDLVKYDEKKLGVGVPPKGKHLFGTVIIDQNRCIQLPEKSMEVFDLHEGDELLVLGDEGEGIGIIKKEVFVKKMEDLFGVLQDDK